MSSADKDCAMAEQDAVAADELKRFCQQLVHTAQFKPVRTCAAGSHAELERNASSMRACGLKLDTQDVDTTLYELTMCVFPHTQRVPHHYNGPVRRVCTEGVHAGYARLIDERSGKILKHLNHTITRYGGLSENQEVHGPALRNAKLGILNWAILKIP